MNSIHSRIMYAIFKKENRCFFSLFVNLYCNFWYFCFCF